MNNEYECRYLFEDKQKVKYTIMTHIDSMSITLDLKQMTYRELSERFRLTSNSTEKKALLYELKIREFDAMQARRKTYFGGNYPMMPFNPTSQTD